MTAKADAVVELEAQIATLTASLEQAKANVESKSHTIEELEKAKQASEQQLAGLQESLAKLKSERDEGSSVLETIKTQVGRAFFVTVVAYIS